MKLEEAAQPHKSSTTWGGTRLQKQLYGPLDCSDDSMDNDTEKTSYPSLSSLDDEEHDSNSISSSSDGDGDGDFDSWFHESSEWLLDKSLHPESSSPQDTNICVMKTFNSMLLEDIKSFEEDNNIAAIAIIEKDESERSAAYERQRLQKRKSLKDFVEARVITFSNNVAYLEQVQSPAHKMEKRRKSLSLHQLSPAAAANGRRQRRKSFHDFVEARVDTFAKNLDFVEDLVEESAHAIVEKRRKSLVLKRSGKPRRGLDTFSRSPSTAAIMKQQKRLPPLMELKRAKSLKHFVEARVDTFSRNMDFAQGKAIAIIKKKKSSSSHKQEQTPRIRRSSLKDFVEARLHTFSKNLDFAQEKANAAIVRRTASLNSITTRRRSLNDFVDARALTFSKNIEFVQLKVIGMIEKELESSLKDVKAIAIIVKRKDSSLSDESERRLKKFIESRVDTLIKNVDVVRGIAKVDIVRSSLGEASSATSDKQQPKEPLPNSELPDQDKVNEEATAAVQAKKQRTSWPGFVQNRLGTFERNMKTISSVIRVQQQEGGRCN